ncbi:uncharacterized protein LOC141689199 isoform X2 [Apium graveolens]|uniref:uncharacterized protein LOC141689199 isoform X2 n=1 Tax=Apium graveolens TaxID=4045 RepID=UPI003D7BFE79
MEPTSSFKGRINKNYSPNDIEKYWDWIHSVDATLGLLRSRPWDASTYRVPNKLRAIKHEAYTPQMVSIGPYHRDKPDLRAMEEFKWRYMLAFVDRVVISDTENTQRKEVNSESKEHSPEILALHKCSKIVSELEEEARAWYAEDMNLDKHQLVEMLLVDGCFILELFLRCKVTDMPKTNDDLHVPPQDQVPFVSLAEMTSLPKGFAIGASRKLRAKKQTHVKPDPKAKDPTPAVTPSPPPKIIDTTVLDIPEKEDAPLKRQKTVPDDQFFVLGYLSASSVGDFTKDEVRG